MYLNKAIVIGNLTRDPESRSLPSGIKVVSFSLATNRVWKDKNGSRQEATDYHNVVTFGRQAENVAQYMTKGSSMLVEGRMQTRSWDAPDGTKKYRTEIVAEKIQFGPKGGANAGGSFNKSEAKASSPAEDSGSAGGFDTIEYPEEDINPEEIPF